MESENQTIDAKSPVYNKMISHFFIKLFILFSFWFVVYGLILRPPRIIDRPLTNFITTTAVKCINLFSPSIEPIYWVEVADGRRNYLIKKRQKVFGIWDECNGIDLLTIYLSIIILLPNTFKRKLVFSIGGTITIILANVIRIISLYFINIHLHNAFELSHHYLFTILMYLLIFYFWFLFVKRKNT